MSLIRFIEHTKANSLDLSEVSLYCAEAELSLLQFGDAIAREITTDYLSGRMDFATADSAINRLFSFVTSPEFFARVKSEISGFTFAAYRAFDEGEYVHPDDLPGESQENKYTRPLLNKLIAEGHAK